MSKDPQTGHPVLVKANRGYTLSVNPTRAGNYMVYEKDIVPVERTIPLERYSAQPTILRESRRLRKRGFLNYYYRRGYILAYDEKKGEFRLVRKKPFPTKEERERLEDVERRWLENEGLTDEEEALLKEYFINASNFTVFKGYAWYARRVKLYGGRLSRDGLSLKNHQEIEGIGFNATGRHVLRVAVYPRMDNQYPFGMVAEEQVVTGNFRTMLNKYKAQSKSGPWLDEGVYREDADSDPVASMQTLPDGSTQTIYKSNQLYHYRDGDATDFQIYITDQQDQDSIRYVPKYVLQSRIYVDEENVRTGRIKTYHFTSPDGLHWEGQRIESWRPFTQTDLLTVKIKKRVL
jgi:hypothetical protein